MPDDPNVAAPLVQLEPNPPTIQKVKLPEIGASTQMTGLRPPSVPLSVSGAQSSAVKSVPKRGSSAGDLANPFKMPSDTEVFSLRSSPSLSHKAQRTEASPTKAKMRVSLYEPPQSHRRNFKALLADDDAENAKLFEKLQTKKDADAMLISQQSKDRQLGKENLHDFVAKKREMFLLQFALGVKKDEIKKLEHIAQAEEQKLLDDERSLEEDAAKFDAFLKENDKNSVEAIKRAEAETKSKLEKVAEIKKLNVQIMAIRSEMSKNEDQLKDYQRYREFLEKLTPAEWLTLHQRQKTGKRASGMGGTSAAGNKLAEDPTANKQRDRGARKPAATLKSKVQFNRNSQATASHSSHTNDMSNAGGEADGGSDDELAGSDDDEFDLLSATDAGAPPPLFFTTPQQLLDIFSELEESNLALIQNCQETEETLEELKVKIAETEQHMDAETESLRQQIDFLNAAIAREEERATKLEEKSKFFTSSLSEADQEKVLADLHSKVKDVYRRCLGDGDVNISTLQMLTGIENRLEKLFEAIEMMPPDKVEKAERIKDKERRQRLREEKMDAQRVQQEERIQRALERARAPVKKKTGKPVVFRSAPPQKKKKRAQDNKNKDEEDLAYYWT
ncbi:hypothetical protein BC828DRAFT_383406 [Blastocladiella britannica]|nr:hypothetical protein BC828DRAFT_383406 [Blastocladiella britannica]